MEELLAFRELQLGYLAWEAVTMAAQFAIINPEKKVINRSLTSYLHQNLAKSNETIFCFQCSENGTIEVLYKFSEGIQIFL